MVRQPQPTARTTTVSEAILRIMLRDAGLRATAQRMALCSILFADSDRHVTAEMLYREGAGANASYSLATIYNTLHKLSEAGLLRQVTVDSTRAYFDTNPRNHHHFFVEGANVLFDIPGGDISVDELPAAPDGFEVARVDVVVRLKRKPDCKHGTDESSMAEKVVI